MNRLLLSTPRGPGVCIVSRSAHILCGTFALANNVGFQRFHSSSDLIGPSIEGHCESSPAPSLPPLSLSRLSLLLHPPVHWLPGSVLNVRQHICSCLKHKLGHVTTLFEAYRWLHSELKTERGVLMQPRSHGLGPCFPLSPVLKVVSQCPQTVNLVPDLRKNPLLLQGLWHTIGTY